MRRLEVWLHGEKIGAITEGRRGGRFAYDDEIADRRVGFPVLSLCLPVKRRPFGEEKTRNWFEGLLPEGERRESLSRRLGIGTYDWIGLLSVIGWECAGAVSVFDESDTASHDGSYAPVAPDELALQLADMEGRRLTLPGSEFRRSLGGYQEKICVAMPPLAQGASTVSAERVFLPQGGAASTHILKPEPANYPGSAMSEAWAMAVASGASRCARAALLDLPGAPATLVVERYDREGTVEEGVTRLHQEDACQALGIPPERKYANEREAKGDDPSYKAIADLLVKYASDPERELVELFRQMTVNIALGNWDAHGKNLSLLYRRIGEPSVAPLYDVVPIAEVEPRTKLISLRVGGTLDPSVVSGETLVSEAESWGMDRRKLEQILEECLDSLAGSLPEAAERFPSGAARHEANTVRRIESLRLR